MSEQPEAEHGKGGFDPATLRRQFAILGRDVAWRKLQALAEGTRLAKERLTMG